MPARVLIADDDAQQRRYLSAVLSAAGYSVVAADGGQAALDRLMGESVARTDLVLLDLHMPEVDGLEVIRRLRAAAIRTPVLVLTADGSVNRAVEAMRAGATDFLIKPVGPERLDVSIRNALAIADLSSEVRRLTRVEENRLSFDELVANAGSTRAAIALARRAARSDIPILIEGESGTGKEVFARAIHGSSDRAGNPFVAVNCGALPAQLVESILFGHEKGAFTGATARRTGKFQEASGGTLFLDEVGELPPEAQVKLLRALQSGEVDPVGATQPVKVDIRLISATNRELSTMIAAGTFREDLFYRLSVFPLRLPPLRERREDLPGLARMFLKRFAAAEGTAVEGFTQAAMEAILRAPWPGNVRQLENTIHRAVVMADGALIQTHDLHGIAGQGAAREPLPGRPGSNGSGTSPGTGANGSAGGHGANGHGANGHGAGGHGAGGQGAGGHGANGHDPFLREDGHVKRLLEIEAAAISRALSMYRGRMSETARRLGIGRSTLYRKIDELRIEKKG